MGAANVYLSRPAIIFVVGQASEKTATRIERQQIEELSVNERENLHAIVCVSCSSFVVDDDDDDDHESHSSIAPSFRSHSRHNHDFPVSLQQFLFGLRGRRWRTQQFKALGRLIQSACRRPSTRCGQKVMLEIKIIVCRKRLIGASTYCSFLYL